MTRTLSILAVSLTAFAMFSATLPATADLTWGMPGGSIMGNYADLMNQYGGGYTPGLCLPGTGVPGDMSLMNGMPTVGIDQWYQYYHGQIMDLWAATGYGSLGILANNQGTYLDNGAARGFWADRWGHEAGRGDQPVYLDVPGRVVTYPDDYGW